MACKLFHLRDLIEFAWHVNHSTKTPTTSRDRKVQYRNAIETFFSFSFVRSYYVHKV